MARQKGSETTGTFENLIFYEREGEFFIRTVPRQTAATRKAAKDYGRASSKAKTLRQLLQPLLPNPKDRDMQNRLTPAMREFLALLGDRRIPQPENNPLAGFRFVPDSDLKNCLLFPWSVTRAAGENVVVKLPSMNPIQSIAAPPGTSRVELQVMLVSFMMNDAHYLVGHPESIGIPYADEIHPPINLFLEMQPEAGSIMILAVKLVYWKQDKRINIPGFRPVEIVSVFIN